MGTLPQRPQPRPARLASLQAWIVWFGVGRLVTGVVATAAAVFAGVWLLRSPSAPIERSLPMTAGASVSDDVDADATFVDSSVAAAPPTSSVDAAPSNGSLVTETIAVHVAGAVVDAGVHVLDADSRVQDAIAAAAGLDPSADADALNLAAFVHDGDRIYVPRAGEPPPLVVLPTPGSNASAGSTPTPTSPVDLNRADAAALDDLPGIGPSTAAAIVAHREQHGPFVSIDDLLEVAGIGPSKLAQIRALVSV